MKQISDSFDFHKNLVIEMINEEVEELAKPLQAKIAKLKAELKIAERNRKEVSESNKELDAKFNKVIFELGESREALKESNKALESKVTKEESNEAVKAEKTKASKLRKQLKEEKLRTLKLTELLKTGIKEQAKEIYDKGFYEGELKRDAIYSASFGRAKVADKKVVKIAKEVAKLCRECNSNEDNSFKTKVGDFKPSY